VSLTARGKVVLSRLARLHKQEIERLRVGVMADAPEVPISRFVRKTGRKI
jgi:hypothetical protein